MRVLPRTASFFTCHDRFSGTDERRRRRGAWRGLTCATTARPGELGSCEGWGREAAPLAVLTAGEYRGVSTGLLPAPGLRLAAPARSADPMPMHT